MEAGSTKTKRTRVRRLPKRGHYDRETIDAILAEALVGHLAFTGDDGQPYAIPTLQARVGDEVWVHGSSASRTLRAVGQGIPACLTVTLIDGLVMARSIFNHSVNYRAVVVLGTARPLTDPEQKLAALEAFAERIAPGRWADARPPTDQEIKATSIMALPLDEASAKVRTGPPGDEDDDLALDVWAGVVPFETVRGEPVPDPRLRPSIEVPDYLRNPGT
ncbi:MAG: pyridoxamine 5'-phosphate oxidase family protein [Solirubrobacterales bacterium]|nr:pyridoxamine 5'-phosphate oxidase family protein [Solirubrobacterales bacterium]